ncbi:MAG: hypothetical protein FJ088_10425, partial [Deltaproteobacteria bacterium]|nr:hypothetical protein [Deltaproteobacteria bacterium]
MMFLYIVSLMILGFFLLFVELAIIPGFGLTGIFGILLIGAGCVMAWIDYGAFIGTLSIFSSLALSGVFIYAISKFGLSKKMVLKDGISSTGGDYNNELSRYRGMEGMAHTPLRPAGAVIIEERRFDAVTYGEFIERGEKIKVVGIELSQL